VLGADPDVVTKLLDFGLVLYSNHPTGIERPACTRSDQVEALIPMCEERAFYLCK
jgi:hypothetical protein